MVIGICGGSGSGKTTLLRRLAQKYSALKPSVFSLDNYYKPKSEQTKDKNGIINFDLPTALDKERLISDLKLLLSGSPIEVVEYQFNVSNKHALLTIAPSELVIVEGLFVLEYQEVFDCLDFKIFVDVDPAIQLDRRIYRDQESRGYSRDAILYQWEHHVIPCYEKYLAPHETKADFIYHNDSRSERDFLRLTNLLEKQFELLSRSVNSVD